MDRFLDLHLTTGLTDWDINEEINLTTTTDQYHQGRRIVGVKLLHLNRAEVDIIFNIYLR